MKQLDPNGAGAPVVLFTYDHTGQVTLFERGALAAAGLDPNEPAARALLELCKSPMEPEHLRRALAGEEVTLTAEVEGRVLEIHHTPLRDPHGKVDLVVGVVLDVSERYATERALRERSDLAHAVMDAHRVLGDVLLVLDDGRIALANDRACELTGYAWDELTALSSVLDLAAADEREALAERFAEGDGQRFETVFARKDGSRVEVTVALKRYGRGAEASASHHAGEATTPEDRSDGRSSDRERIVLLVREALYETTAAQAAGRVDDGVTPRTRRSIGYDTLTDLPDRSLFLDRLEQAVVSARRESARLALLLVDLERFREVNDALGHRAGDTLLRTVGQRLRDLLRDSDTLARTGGDEFAAILPSTDATGAERVARNILGALAAPVLIEGRTVASDASIGVAVFPDHATDTDDLVGRAEHALREAKTSGSGYAFATPATDRDCASELALLAELHDGLERGELVLHYQPLVSLRSGRVVEVEALARWQHPRRGLLPPSEFIPLVERTGLVRSLSSRVLTTALGHCRGWRLVGRDVSVAVNLSVRDLLDPQLPESVTALLQAWDARPEWLRLEVTESVVLTDTDRVAHTLARLRELGIVLAIDDLGAGYASLSTLQRLPVDQVKIDKSFVQRVTSDPGAAAIVRATIELGHALGLEVVTEGVEDRETWDALATMGCDLVQGYYVSRPLPLGDIERTFDEARWRSAASA